MADREASEAYLHSTEADVRAPKGSKISLKDAFNFLKALAFSPRSDASAAEIPLQVVFSFDTTGSMRLALVEVRARLSELLQRLQTDLPGVTTAVVAHGDYCDARKTYITKHIDFTNDLQRLVTFVNDVESTSGGDAPEAYEVMLRLVRKDLSWSPGSRRILVVIGDAWPHLSDDIQNKDRIDWEAEARILKEQLVVRIYGIQIYHHTLSTDFFRRLTKITEGQHLNLSKFEPLCDVIMAVCYREKGPEYLQKFEAEVRAREGSETLHKDLEDVFKALGHHASSVPITAPAPEVTTVDLPTSRVPKRKRTSSKGISSHLLLSLFFCVFVLVCMIIRVMTGLFCTGLDFGRILLIILALTLILLLSV